MTSCADQAAQSEDGDEVDSVTLAQRDAAVREYSTAYEGYRALVAQEDEGINLTTLERAQPVQIDTGGFTAPRTRASRVPSPLASAPRSVPASPCSPSASM